MDEKKAVQIGTLHMWFDDYREDEFNESTSCDFSIWKSWKDDSMTIEDYWSFCKRFAAAMGYCERAINDWFGEY
jgi:hypothetical protein